MHVHPCMCTHACAPAEVEGGAGASSHAPHAVPPIRLQTPSPRVGVRPPPVAWPLAPVRAPSHAHVVALPPLATESTQMTPARGSVAYGASRLCSPRAPSRRHAPSRPHAPHSLSRSPPRCAPHPEQDAARGSSTRAQCTEPPHPPPPAAPPPPLRASRRPRGGHNPLRTERAAMHVSAGAAASERPWEGRDGEVSISGCRTPGGALQPQRRRRHGRRTTPRSRHAERHRHRWRRCPQPPSAPPPRPPPPPRVRRSAAARMTPRELALPSRPTRAAPRARPRAG